MECCQPKRSAMTVAGIVGHTVSRSRIRSSISSTSEPFGARWYFGAPADRRACLTVFFEHPIVRAIALIGIVSAQCSRRISAQSSADNTRFLLASTEVSTPKGVSFRLPSGCQSSPAADN